MSRRPRRIVPEVITALVLVALGAYVATLAIGSLLGDDPTRSLAPLVETGSATTWADPGVIAAGAALALLGLVLLLCGLLPGRQVVVALDAPTTDGGSSSAGITRTSIRRAVQDAARDVDGVRSARARVAGRRIDVRAQAAVRDTSDIGPQVEQAVAARLHGIPLSRQPRVRVRTTAARSDA